MWRVRVVQCCVKGEGGTVLCGGGSGTVLCGG